MHPALRKGPRFLQTHHFPFFTKKTPPFSTFVRKKHPSQFHFLPTVLRTQHDWGLGVPTTNVGLFHVQIQSQHKQMLLFAAINHLTFTGHKRLMQQTFRSPKQATSYSFKKSHSTTEGNPVQIQLQHKQMFLFVTINHLTFTGHKRLMQQTFQSPKQAMSYTVR